MTTAETDMEIGRIARTYENLIRKRACLRRRLKRHADSLSSVVHALTHWDTSVHAKDAADLLEASKMEAVYRDVTTMIEVDKDIVQAEENMREVGLANLVRGK